MFNLISATSIGMHSNGVKTFISSLSWKVSFFRLHLCYLSCYNNMFSMIGTERVLKSQSKEKIPVLFYRLSRQGPLQETLKQH